MTDNVANRIEPDEWVNIEIDDLYDKELSSEGDVHLPEERSYKIVEILDSGWVRCIRPRHEDGQHSDEKESIDYYPPNRVNRIISLEVEGIQ